MLCASASCLSRNVVLPSVCVVLCVLTALSCALSDVSYLGDGTKIPRPTNLQLFFINISAVNISWGYPSGDDPLPIQFQVGVCHDGDNCTVASSLLKEKSFVFNGMLFSAYYQFQVVAYFEGVASEPAESDVFINGITAPAGPPVDVRALLWTPTEVTVEWEGPPSPTPVIYFVYWGDEAHTLNKMKVIYQGTHARFSDLSPDSTFYVHLRAGISGRLSIFSKTVSVPIPPSALPAPIIKNHTQSELWVWLEWEVPFDLYPLPYQVDNFTLCYSNSSPNATSLVPSVTSFDNDLRPLCEEEEEGVLVLGGQRSSANITGLESGRSYCVWLTYCSKAGVGSYWSNGLCVETYPGPLTQPLNLRVVAVTSRSLTLQWTPPTSAGRNGPLIRYLLISTCHASDPAATDGGGGEWHLSSDQDGCKCKDINASISADSLHEKEEEEEVEHVLTGLMPSSIYSIRVAAATWEEEGPYSLETEGTTEDELLKYPHDIDLSALVIWDHTPTVPSSHINHTPTLTDTCEWYLLLTWNFSFQQDNTTPTNATPTCHSVSFDSLNLVSLVSVLCSSLTNHTESSCISLNSTTVIMHNRYILSEEEAKGIVKTPPPSNGSLSLGVWLELILQLSNGSMLQVTSRRVVVEGLNQCTTGNGSHLQLTLMLALLPLVILGAILLLISVLALCLCKHLKRRRRLQSSLSEIMLEDCQQQNETAAEWNRDPALRVGDGQTSSSCDDSHRSSPSSEDTSSVTETADTSTTSSLDETDELSPLFSQDLGPMVSGMSASRWRGSRNGCVGVVDGEMLPGPSPLGLGLGEMCLHGREEPDGCSFSSGSVDSVNVKDQVV